MNESADIWNLLHDGNIDAVGRNVADQITLEISIEYLTHKMGLGDGPLTLRLENCRHFVYREYSTEGDGYLPSSGYPIDCMIVSNNSKQTPFEITLCSGTLVADFDKFTLCDRRESGISFEHLSKAVKDYWDEWRAGHVK